MNNIRPCECPAAGWCERHQIHKTADVHALCQVNAAFRQSFDIRTTDDRRAGYDISAPNPLSCVHRGDETGELRACQTCRGTTRIKLFECTVHGNCTLARPLDDIACCETCPDKKPTP